VIEQVSPVMMCDGISLQLVAKSLPYLVTSNIYTPWQHNEEMLAMTDQLMQFDLGY